MKYAAALVLVVGAVGVAIAIGRARPAIRSRETTPVSMMPTGLFDSLADRDVIDLVAYLRTAVKNP